MSGTSRLFDALQKLATANFQDRLVMTGFPHSPLSEATFALCMSVQHHNIVTHPFILVKPFCKKDWGTENQKGLQGGWDLCCQYFLSSAILRDR